jgi:hypothetical protein
MPPHPTPKRRKKQGKLPRWERGFFERCGRVASEIGLDPDWHGTRSTSTSAFLISKRCCKSQHCGRSVVGNSHLSFAPSYDQGQVAQSALEFSVLPNLPDSNTKRICQDLAADILEYTARDLRSHDGGFYSAEDADSGESLEHPEKHIGTSPPLVSACERF